MSALRPASGSPEVVDAWSAIAELYRTHRLSMVRTAALLCGDRLVAEEIVQDAFVALQRGWARLDSTEAAVAYLRVSVVNGSRNVRRHLAVARRHLRVAEPDFSPEADVALLVEEEHREVLAALRRLPHRQREVLVLRYWSDLSEADIAAAMGISRGTVKSTASRALAALESLLKETS